jgi:predicted ATPase/DNA-binding SARP family transcriptional activator
MVPAAETALRLLGGPTLVVGDASLVFSADKRHALLAYLAWRGDWVSRDRLADLFWTQATTSVAKQNLRRLLGRVRALPWLHGLEVERNRLRWLVPTDLERFRAAVAGERWDEALALYGGPFARALSGYEDNEFASWLAHEREHWHSLWRDVTFRHAARLADSGQRQRAADLLRRLLDHDGLDEDALGAYLEVAGQAGDQRAALDIYARFRRTLRRELGLAPTAATQRRAEALERLEPPATETRSRAAAGPPTGVPAPTSSFVGRDAELAEITRLLAQPACRVLTLTGPGGVGKTRLAMQAATALASRYPRGVAFVEVETVASETALMEAIAAGLGLPLGDTDDQLDEVARHVGDTRVLLVLDAFEHLVAAAASLASLTSRCANLQVLVTSRVRLPLALGWTLPIEGLAWPSQTVSLDVAGGYDAVALFGDRARRVDPRFALGPDDLPHVTEICRLVQGSPLGIELAAVWVRVLGCADILQELRADLDFLSAPIVGGEERNASVRAAFEHSWALLTPPERLSLRRLGVFRGGFDREAAASVADTSVALLAALVDKSLLRVSADKRYEIHALLRQFAREKLAQDRDDEARTHAAHGAFFLSLTERAEPLLNGAQREAWLRRLDLEYENARAALAHASTSRDPEIGLRLASSLWRYWWLRGRYREGRAYLEQALAQAQAATPGTAHAKALGGIGVLAWAQTEYDLARTCFERSLAMRRELGDELGVVDMLNNLGILAHELGAYGQARAHYRAALAADRRLGERAGEATVLGNLGSLALDEGDLDAAHAAYGESLALCRALADRWGVADRLIGLGTIELRRGRDARALARFEESVAIARSLGDEARVGFAIRGAGRVAIARGDWAAARAAFDESLAIARTSGDRRAEAYSLQGLGLAALGRAELGEATAALEEALALHGATSDLQGSASTLHGLGRLELARGDADSAGQRFAQGLALLARGERSVDVAHLLEGLAEVAALRNHDARALCLLGAAERLREQLGSALPARDGTHLASVVTSLRRRHPRARADDPWDRGRGLDLERAVREALHPDD